MRAAWKLYIASDKATLEKYHHLFPARHNPDLQFVTFQQVVLRDKAATATEEELFSIEEFISKHLEKKREQDERPWNVLKVDEAQSEVDLERQYVEE